MNNSQISPLAHTSRVSGPTSSREHWVALAVAAITIVALAPTLGGYFQSDDFAYVYALASARESGAGLLPEAMHNFARGLTAGESHFYRPLTYASFALDYELHGAEPFGYRAVNAVLHGANAALVAHLFLAIGRQAGVTASLTAAALAGLIFGLFPASLEVSAWISGRFDALTTLFVLLCLACFVRKDPWRHGAPIALIFALMAKESGVLAVVLAGVAAIADRPAAATGASLARRWRTVAVRLAPLVLVTIAYFGMRWLIFGTPFKVYANANTLQSIIAGTWIESLRTWPRWFRRSVDGSDAARLFMVCIAAGWIVLVSAVLRDKALRRLTGLYAAAILIAIALVFSSTPGFAPDGRNGRLFYEVLVPASWLFALPATLIIRAVGDGVVRGRTGSVAGTIYAAVLLVAMGWLFVPAMAAWRDVGLQARALRDVLARTAADSSGDEYSVIFAPDWNRNIPFALNAQGGFLLPPFQVRPVISRVVLQTQADFELFVRTVEAGLVTQLRNGRREAILEQVNLAGRTANPDWPTRYWCWRGDTRSAQAMAVPQYADTASHIDALRRAYERCIATQGTAVR